MGLNLNYEAEVLVDTDVLTNEQWLDYRRKGIGGSDCAAIMGCSPFTTLRDLYYDKRGIQPVMAEENRNWVQLEVGHRLEELVAQIFSKKTGLEVYPIRKMFRHPLYPFMLADVDFFIRLPNGKTGILECKTTNYNNQDKWANNSTPVNYEYQGRHYMAVMNLDEVYFACLYGNSENEFFIRHVERDLDIEEALIAEEENFWKEFVQKGIEPPYTEKPDLVLASIRKHVGPADKDADAVKLSRLLQRNLESYLLLKAEKSELDAKVKKLEEQMKNCYAEVIEEMGVSCLGTLTDGKSAYTVKYSPQYRTSVSKDSLERLKANHPDIYDDYVTTNETRIFSVKKKEVA